MASFQYFNGVKWVVHRELGRIDMRYGRGLADDTSMQRRFTGKFISDGRGGTVTPEASGTGFLCTGIHVALVVVNHPGDIIIFPQGIIEGAVTDVINGTVAGEHDNLAQHIVEAVGICLIQGKLGSQVPQPTQCQNRNDLIGKSGR